MSSISYDQRNHWWFWPIAIVGSLAVHAVVIGFVAAPGPRSGFVTRPIEGSGPAANASTAVGIAAGGGERTESSPSEPSAPQSIETAAPALPSVAVIPSIPALDTPAAPTSEPDTADARHRDQSIQTPHRARKRQPSASPTASAGGSSDTETTEST